jgi:hypothetical protein
MVQFQRLDKNLGQDERIQSILLPNIPLVPKPLELPQYSRYFFQDKTNFTLSSRSPKTSNMSYHTTTLKILDTLILSLVLVLKKTHENTSRPFLDIFSTMEVQSSWFLRSSIYNQILFLSIYNTQNPNPTHTFQCSKKSSNLAFFHHQKTCLHFLSLHQIYSSSPHHLISSFPQNPLSNLLVKTWSTKLMKSFHWVADIVLHLWN